VLGEGAWLACALESCGFDALGGSAGEPPRKRTRSHVEETGGPIEELFIACNEPCFNVRVSFNSCNPGFINNKTTRIRLGFTTLHDSRRYAIPLSMPGSLTPRHKGTVCGDDEYAPINL
jgi:hypothetical protein